MLLTCAKCRHQWEESVPARQTVVLCPECDELTPTAVAVKSATPPAAPPGAPVERTIVEPVERTVAAAPKGGLAPVRLEEPPPGAPPPPAHGGSPAGLQKLIGRVIDGYEIKKVLGAGGMGAVFLARQISLERDVAFKVLAPRFAKAPDFVARFTREAYAAAQLNHHNIVQVYDVGCADGINYITMEFVNGASLGGLIKQEGRLQLDDATAYVLQAARGLKYAHERGIIHRDIKPDNLLLNEHGVVKIADMGLAKRLTQIEPPSGPADVQALKAAAPELTQAHAAMGTPAYMPPEQARDAGHVDARADQYSLGCTLYYLCAGRAPYEGTTAYELMGKHITEPLTPLDVYVTGVPAALNVILRRMLEKEPARRYPGMTEAIADLEAYLGVESEKGPYTPREVHLKVLEAEQAAHAAAPAARLRRPALLGLAGGALGLFVLALLAGSPALAGGFLGLLPLTLAAHFVIGGLRSGNLLFRRVRSVFFAMPARSWLLAGAGTLLGVGVLWILGWLWPWLGFSLLAAALAALYEWRVARPLRAQRAQPIAKTREMLKQLRVRGVSEEALHNFVCRFGGDNWEEFFEDLFGYEEMVAARGKWGDADRVKPRKKFGVWRDPAFRWLESIEQGRKDARARRELARVETVRLKAQGATERDATRQAQENATRIMTVVNEKIKKPPPERAKAREEEEAPRPARPAEIRFRRLPQVFLTGRLLLGLLMIAGWAARGDTVYGVRVPALLRYLYARIGYHQWGAGATNWGLLVGLALLISSYSTRLFAPALVTAGAVLLLLLNVAVRLIAQPQFNGYTGLALGGGLILAGLGISFFNRWRGRKF